MRLSIEEIEEIKREKAKEDNRYNKAAEQGYRDGFKCGLSAAEACIRQQALEHGISLDPLNQPVEDDVLDPEWDNE